MTRRFAFFAALTTAALFGAEAWGQGSSVTPPRFSGFTQGSSPASVQYTRSTMAPLNSKLTVTATGTFEVSRLDYLLPAQAATYTNATLTMMATSGTAATDSGGATSLKSQEGFSGSFNIMQGSTVLLHGTFMGSGSLEQIVRNNRPSPIIFYVSDADFTSDIFKPLFDEEFQLQFLGNNPVLMVNNNQFQNFTTDAADGSFNALVVPEPATLAMAGFGLLGLPVALRVARRRRSGSAN